MKTKQKNIHVGQISGGGTAEIQHGRSALSEGVPVTQKTEGVRKFQKGEER